MKTTVATLLFAAGLSLARAASASEPSPGDLHAARCVAALEVNTEDLARQVKSGKEGQRGLLMDRLVSGAAFVADAYLRGDSDEKQARELANEALEAQKSLSSTELSRRQVACADEGGKLHASANALQRAIVKRVAKRRMDRLLAD